MHFALLVDHWLFRVLAIAALVLEVWAVSYTHLTLPTNREV